MSKTADHGKLFDVFPQAGGETQHGGHFDERFGGSRGQSGRHGKLFDDGYRKPRAGDGKHGEHWDRFEWTDMPSLHSDRFDTDFKVPVAHGSDHGTWFDVFRGGRTHVRYLYGGRDHEGVITHLSSEAATVESRRGERHEIGLPQILAYHTLQGNPHNDEVRTAAQVDIKAERGLQNPPAGNTGPSNSSSASGGRLNANRTGVDVAAITESIFANKTESLAKRAVDEATRQRPAIKAHCETHPTHIGSCPGCQRATLRAAKGQLAEATAAKTFAQALAPLEALIAKAVDSTETATQGQDVEGKGSAPSGKAWCPHCKHYCKKPTEDGLCPTCGGRVEAHKSIAESVELLKTYT